MTFPIHSVHTEGVPTGQVHIAPATPEQLAAQFFQQSAGHWRSERRYYTLQSGEVQEVVSLLTVDYLRPGCPELVALAQRHGLDDAQVFVCGARATWSSHDQTSQSRLSRGSTVFGVRGSMLFRDRGFATPKPVTADYFFRDAKTLCLRTEYNDSSFEEELKLIGTAYRTRQTIISRAGAEMMIGQYLETRLDESALGSESGR
ncbi:phycobiliprotein lyase [Synechococcales cyanobacterium C]|uniref:Chromophore lyase CpcS/CpeS n=1 Tax=Petrachloros mirabilis ULC683 TaxID=2781853 RepID=A0A8K2A658_9CYAN|nr:phycobiliprotein lyase [Petrachloros mirabilis]NCJ04990.1 phycobiliprotein lyase [Petrachloros mirabilis ULC683]